MKKTVFIIVFIPLFLLVSIQPCVSWNNDHVTGWGTADNPGYGTHDWIAEEAYRLLPTSTRGWLTDNLAVYLWGTSAPDNAAGSYEGAGGYGDTAKHHNYYNIDGTFVTDEDDASTRAQEEYDKAFAELQNDNLDLAAFYAGAMTHYIADMAVWGHVMTGEVIHSYFEDDVEGTIIADYFNDPTFNHTSNTFTITFDGTLEDISAYNAAKDMGWDTFNDSGGTYNYLWMDSNYPGGTSAWIGYADTWPEGEFKDRVSESINLAVNYIAAVLNKLTTETGVVPTIDHPDDITYEEGSTGNSITWHPSDANPYTFNVTRNEILVNSGIWDGGNITVNVDGLSVGTYIFTCTVNDTDNHSVIDTVIVMVENVAAPVIDNPVDITYKEGSFAKNITWHPQDLSPHMYNVTRNGTVVESGIWDGGNITVNVDGLSVGTYIFTCNVNDTLGNSVSDSVTVTVTEAEEDEEFPWLWVVISLVVIVAIIGLAVIYFKKR